MKEDVQENPEEMQKSSEEMQGNPEEMQESSEGVQESSEEVQESSEEVQENPEEMQRSRAREGKRARHGFWFRGMLVLLGLLVFGAGCLFFGWSVMERKKEKQRLAEGERLREAVAVLFMEKVSREGEENLLGFGEEIYWIEIGDRNHPLYGSCPGNWDAGGRITSMVVSERGELLELIYEGEDEAKEIWRFDEADGKLAVEVSGD